MTLTANRDVDHYIDQELRSFLVAANTHIYKGALVGLSLDDGNARPMMQGDLFVGIAYEEINNWGDGERSVRVYTLGDFCFKLPGSTLADIGRPVYAPTDDSVFFVGDRPRGIYGGSYVGRVVGIVEPGEIILRLDTMKRTVAYS